MFSGPLSVVWATIKSLVPSFPPTPKKRNWRSQIDDDSEMEEPNMKKRRQPIGLRAQPSASSEVNERHITAGTASWILTKQQSFETIYSVTKQTPYSASMATARGPKHSTSEVVNAESSEASNCGRLTRLPIHAKESQPKVTKTAQVLQSNEPIIIDLTEEVKEDPTQYVKQNSSKNSASDPKCMDFSTTQFKYVKRAPGGYNNINQIAEKYVRRNYGFPGRTAKDCVRLEEKEMYRKLMQDQTSMLLPDVTAFGFTQVVHKLSTNYKKKLDEVGIVNLPVTTEKVSVEKGEEMKRRCTKRHSAPLVDLTTSVWENQSTEKPYLSPKTKEGIEKFQFLDVEKFHDVGKSSENDAFKDDVVIVDDISPTDARSPRWNRRRSQLHTRQSCYADPTWLADFNHKYGSDRLALEHAIKEQTQKASEAAKQKEESQKVCAKIKKKHSVKDIVSGFHEIDIIDITPDEDLVESLPELSTEMLSTISAALRSSPPNEVLVEGFGIPVMRRDMHTLDGTIWLNDSVINFYMNLLIERGKLDNFPSVYACSTFFYPKLMKDGYNSLRRWTKKIDIFAHDFLVVPVHLGLHWCLAVADFKKKEVNYYDSMGGRNDECLVAIQEYVKAESLDKKKTKFNMDDWKLQNIKNIPQQQNGCDCGVFACQYAASITRNAKITFTQNDMPYFRKRMVYEILKKSLL